MEKANAEAERILSARAHTMAREPRPAPAAGTMLELLELRLASERYALETRHVRVCTPCEN